MADCGTRNWRQVHWTPITAPLGTNITIIVAVITAFIWELLLTLSIRVACMHYVNVNTMASWCDNDFLIAVPLCGGVNWWPVHFHSKWNIFYELFVINWNKILNRQFEFPVIWDIVMLMWCHCNASEEHPPNHLNVVTKPIEAHITVPQRIFVTVVTNIQNGGGAAALVRKMRVFYT